ncbi:class I tRNA ligase family protein, partial [Streptomyces sp. tea 10]|nr:class I tRNA ligase family protein [Streptomyces sp. tea 10]
MIAKNLGGAVPEPRDFTAEDLEMLEQAESAVGDYRAAFDELAFHRGLETVWRVIASANRYFTAQQPWVLRKTDPERMATVLYVTAEVLRIVAILVQPVMPDSMARLLDQLGQPEGQARQFSALGTRLAAGTELPKPSGVFPRYEAPEALQD